MTTTDVAVAGVSCGQSPANLRERVHFASNEGGALSREFAGRGHEAVALATCNRTELYVTGAGADEALQHARHALAELGVGGQLLRSAYVHANEDAARHLFRVASGLESIVFGDTHVVAQVREAHKAARRCAATGPILDRLFEAASSTSKRVRAQTAVSAGVTTIAGAAIAVAARLAGPLQSRRVLVLGAGATATAAVLSAASRGCRHIVIANRSLERALGLAQRVDGRGIPLDELDAQLASADVIFSATASRGFVLTAQHAEGRFDNGRRPVLVFDLGLPRDVDPAFRDMPGFRLLDLDDLARVIRATESERRHDLVRAEAIILDAAARWEQWRRARAAAPAIAALHADAEQARRHVLQRYASDLARLAPDQQALVETITTQLVARLVHAPTGELRRQALLTGDTA